MKVLLFFCFFLLCFIRITKQWPPTMFGCTKMILLCRTTWRPRRCCRPLHTKKERKKNARIKTCSDDAHSIYFSPLLLYGPTSFQYIKEITSLRSKSSVPLDLERTLVMFVLSLFFLSFFFYSTQILECLHAF